MSEEKVTEILVNIANKNDARKNDQVAYTADFFMRAKVKRVFTGVATVEKADETVEVIPYFKAELHSSYDQRKVDNYPSVSRELSSKYWPPKKVKARNTIIVSKKQSILYEIFRNRLSFTDGLYVATKAMEYGVVSSREAEIRAEINAKIAEYKQDEKRIAATRKDVADMEAVIREKLAGKLRQQLRILVRSGWKLEDVAQIFEEEQCREVQES